MGTEQKQDTNIVSEYYDDYKQTQAEILATQSKKVRNAIFTIAGLLLASDLLGLAMANQLSGENLLYALAVPLILVGIGLLAIRQPLLAIILAALVFAGLIVLSIVIYGGIGAISGLLIKAVIIYFIFAGFQSANEAEQAKKELRS